MTEREINLVTARPENGMLKLFITVDGKVQEFRLSRPTAAAAVDHIVKALAQGA